MTLKLDMLVPQLEDMGRELARSRHEDQKALRLAREWLHRYADDFATLATLADAHRAACPTAPLNARHEAPHCPHRFTVVGSDGSVIPPDRHAPALYYLINIGGLVFRKGSGQAPQPFHTSRLAYTRGDLHEGPRLVEGNLLDIRRDLAELRALANYTEAESRRDQAVPVIALADGTLLLWVLEESPPEKRQARIGAYLDEMDRFASIGAPIAGFISRPRYRGVLRLLWMAHLHEQGQLESGLPPEDPFPGLADRQLFADLPAGTRTGLFISTAKINAFYRARNHEVLFCYLNVGQANDPEIARLEVPSWVANRPRLLDLVHAAVLDQCRVPGGYPYVLARAHEQALVTTRERRHLEGMVVAALIRQGIVPRPSRKARLKELTGSPQRRHRL